MVGSNIATVLYDRYGSWLPGSWGPCTEQTRWSSQILYVPTTNSLRKVDTSFLGAVNLYYLSWEDLTFVLSPILVQLFYIKVRSCLRMCSISNVFKRLLSIIGLIGSYTSGTLRFNFPKYRHFDLKSSFELDCPLKKNSTQRPVVCGWWTERSPGRPGQHRRPPQRHRAQQTM